MTASTTNFNLPYPDSTDAPCDFAQQWCEFTDAIDVIFDRFQATLDRTVPMIPITVMRVTEQIVSTVSYNIPYDTLVIDSAGWTAVDVDSTMISPDMAGVLSFHVSVLHAQAAAPGAAMVDPVDSTGTLTEPNLPFKDQMDMNTCPVGIPLELAVMFSNGIWVPGFSGIRNQTLSTVSPFTLQQASYAIYWHADGGTV